MFDSIIAETNERFNLNGKAEKLLSALLAFMTDETRGGLTGFTEKFNQIGVGDSTSNRVNTQISKQQTESALGTDTLNDIAVQSGVDYDTTAAATAFMIPPVMDSLAPNGVLSENKDLLSRVRAYTTGVNAAPNLTSEETFDRVGTAAIPVIDSDKTNTGDANTIDDKANPIVDRVDASAGNIDGNYKDYNNNSPLAWILPLLLLGLLLVLGYWFCSKPPAASTITTNIQTDQGSYTR
ncbi:MAG TPA: YidB family protein [Pyrinomonadaceae bacterium]|nr:YidB family protein [Pyrinomonadaceae bacterium]